MAKKTIKFEVVTPEKIVLKKQILQVTVPTEDGEITVLPEHIPLISILKPGVVEIKLEDGELEVMAVSGGFLEVMRNKIVILADTAERAEDLDEARIEEAKKRAEESKRNIANKDEIRFTNIAIQLDKELARLKALSRWRHLKR